MTTLSVELSAELVALLHQSNQSAGAAALEAIVLELYRRGTISSGKAAALLGMGRFAFIAHASKVGIAWLDMSDDEWASELQRSRSL